MRIGFRGAMAATLLALVPAAAKGADASFAYQGLLLDEKGNVLEAQGHTVEFRLYSQATGGEPLWSCTRDIILSSNGLFAVELSGLGPGGESLGEVFTANASKTLYVGLTVDGDKAEIEPRQKLLSVPKALLAADAIAARDAIAVSSNLVGSAAAEIGDASAKSLVAAGGMVNDGMLMAGSMSVDDIVVEGSITGNGAIPVGGIVIWSGSVASIPEGWALCDGRTSNGYATPNLSDRFVLGAAGKYAVGAQGGSERVTLSIENIPSHRHAYRFKGGFVSLLVWKDGKDFYDIPAHYSGNGVSAYTGNAGGNKSGNTVAHDNMPPYYALCYIMRVK